MQVSDFTDTAKLALTLKAIKPILGSAADEFGAAFADKVRFYRWKQQFKILDRANQFLKERGVEAKPIHLKVLLPLLDAASLEEEPELEEMWAKLLASASENNTEKSFYFVATEILKNISSKEAVVLEWMYGKWRAKAARESYGKDMEVYISGNLVRFDVVDTLQALNTPFKDGPIMIDNLMRLNLIEYGDNAGYIDFQTASLPYHSRIHLTQLAIRLMEVCGTDDQCI
jgi:hypothetical protein